MGGGEAEDAPEDAFDALLEQYEDEAIVNMYENRRALKAAAVAAQARVPDGSKKKGKARARATPLQFDL